MVTSLCSLSRELVTEIFTHVDQPLSKQGGKAYITVSDECLCALQIMPCYVGSCRVQSTRPGAVRSRARPPSTPAMPPCASHRAPQFSFSPRTVRLTQLVHHFTLGIIPDFPSKSAITFEQCVHFLEKLKTHAISLTPLDRDQIKPWGSVRTATLYFMNAHPVVSWNALLAQFFRVGPAIRFLTLNISCLAPDLQPLEMTRVFGQLHYVRVLGNYFQTSSGIANLKAMMGTCPELQTVSTGCMQEGRRLLPCIDACESHMQAIRYGGRGIDVAQDLLMRTWVLKLEALRLSHFSNGDQLLMLRMPHLTQLYLDHEDLDELPIAHLTSALNDNFTLPALRRLDVGYYSFVNFSGDTAAQLIEGLAACEQRGIMFNAVFLEEGYMDLPVV